MKKILLLTLAALVLLPAFAGSHEQGQEKRYALYGVAFYNLENLFDTIHTVGRNDWEYLPEGQNKWGTMKYTNKLRNMAKVLAELCTDKLPHGAAIIGVPIGLLTAVFLSKAADPKLRTVVVTAIELLSGIPSVVFGLLGMQVLVPAVAKTFGKASGACLLSAIVVLSIMILPSIVSVSVTALNAVPPEYEQGSLALGATDTETWFKISIPAAKSGIAAGVVLGIGRAIGEAMAVMMVAGNSPNMPDSPFRSVTFLTTAIAKEMSYAGGLQRQALFSIALVLFVFIMAINVLLNAVLKGGNKDEK